MKTTLQKDRNKKKNTSRTKYSRCLSLPGAEIFRSLLSNTGLREGGVEVEAECFSCRAWEGRGWKGEVPPRNWLNPGLARQATLFAMQSRCAVVSQTTKG